MLNITKQEPTACVWVEAKLALKKSEQSNGQQSLGFRKTAPPRCKLLVVKYSVLTGIYERPDTWVTYVSGSDLIDMAEEEGFEPPRPFRA